MAVSARDSLPTSTDSAPALERATLRAVSRRLIPFLFVLYVVSFLDRVNVGFAALEMNRDLGLSPSVYGFGAGIFFIGYSLFEVPSESGDFRSGFLSLACAPLAGMALALRLRHAAVLRDGT